MIEIGSVVDEIGLFANEKGLGCVINVTDAPKGYSKNRTIQVRFSDGSDDWFALSDLSVMKNGVMTEMIPARNPVRRPRERQIVLKAPSLNYYNPFELTRDSVSVIIRDLFKRMRHLISEHNEPFELGNGVVITSPWTEKQISENCSSTIGDICKGLYPESQIRTDGGNDNASDTYWDVIDLPLEQKVAKFDESNGNGTFRGCIKPNKRPGAYLLIARNKECTKAFACIIDLSDLENQLWKKKLDEDGTEVYYGASISAEALYEFAVTYPDKFDLFVGYFFVTHTTKRTIPHIGLEEM